MNARNYKKKNTKKLIFFTIITTIIVVTLSLSKYRTTKAKTDETSTATPILSMSSSVLTEKISPENCKGSEIEYIFSVQNYDNKGTRTEITMEYVLQIKNLANLPLEFELYAYDDGKEEFDTTNLLDSKGCVTDKLTWQEDKTQTYKLKIRWQDGENSYLYSGELDYVQIILDGTQEN